MLEGKTIILVRGLPGSGKSTLALSLVDNDPNRMIENDQFWTFGEKSYEFVNEMWQIARDWCVCESFRRLLVYESVAVANVFFLKSLMEPFLDHAARLGVKVILKSPDTPWADDVDQCFLKNTHACPLDRLKMFKEKWEDVTQEWIDSYLSR
jgi:hypothetical protein